MSISPEQLAQAVTKSLPFADAAFIPRVLSCIEQTTSDEPEAVDREQAAVAVAAALLSSEPAAAVATINGLDLKRVAMAWGDGQVLDLDARDAIGHPLLTPWIGLDLAQALSALVWAGGVGALLAASAPLPQEVWLEETTTAPGVSSLEAAISYTFAGADGRLVSVRAVFGDAAAGSLVVSKRISAVAFVQLGMELRRPLEVSAPTADPIIPDVPVRAASAARLH